LSVSYLATFFLYLFRERISIPSVLFLVIAVTIYVFPVKVNKTKGNIILLGPGTQYFVISNYLPHYFISYIVKTIPIAWKGEL